MSGTVYHVKNAYNEWAEIYDTNENPTRDLNYKVIREASFELVNKKVLEIGCGTGLNTIHLAQKAQKVVAVDLSEEMLAKARQRVNDKNIEFIKADITQTWNFDDDSFDLVVANLVLEHIKNLDHIFSKANRVLSSEGIFYVAELHPYKQLQQSQAKFTSPKTGEEVSVDAFTHSISEYINEGIEAGLSLQEIKEWQQEDEQIPRLLTLCFKK